jgi:hypothetical protein
MAFRFGILKNRAIIECERTFNPPAESLPHGDFPHLDLGWPDGDRDANHAFRTLVIWIGIAVALLVAWLLMLFLLPGHAQARDDGRYQNMDPALHAWFEQLSSGNGLCCSFADGFSIADVDWDVRAGHYRVQVDGRWIDVPDTALVSEPNRFGPAVVWPYRDADGVTQIRCFLPGAGT